MAKKTTLKINGERIILRKIFPSDAKRIHELLQEKDMFLWLDLPWPYKKEDAIKWVRKTRYNLKNKKEYSFGIILKKENKLIGVISLMNINHEDKNAELGYWLGKRYWAQGYTNEATKLILNFAFNTLRLHKVYANVYEENIASRKVLEKNGFKLEGKLRDNKFKHDTWQNELRFGILESEYLEQKTQIFKKAKNKKTKRATQRLKKDPTIS